jgi:hypothetical protein
MAYDPTRPRRVTPLKLAIIASGRPQKDIAAEIGIDPSHLSRIVNGLHCDDGTREKLAAALGRNVSDVFDVDGSLGEAA